MLSNIFVDNESEEGSSISGKGRGKVDVNGTEADPRADADKAAGPATTAAPAAGMFDGRSSDVWTTACNTFMLSS